MKKFFSLLCAVMLVMSASAKVSLADSKLSAKKTAIELKSQLPAEAFAADVRMARIAPAAVSDVKKAPAAVQNGVITVDYVQAFYLGDMQDVDGLWEFGFFDGDDLVLDIALLGTDGTHIVGTYDMTASDASLVVAAGDTVALTTGSLVVAYDEAAKGYTFTLSATADNNASYTMSYACAKDDVVALDYLNFMLYQYGLADISDVYITLKDAPVVITGDTVEIAVPGYSSLEWYDETGDYFAVGQNDEYGIVIDWFPATAGTPVGTYKDATDFDFEYCYVVDLLQGAELAAETVELTVTEANDTIYMDVNMLAEDGNVYHALLKNYTITPKQTIDVVFTDQEISTDYMEDYGALEFIGANDAYMLDFVVAVNEGIVGQYTEEDVLSLNSARGSFFGDLSTMYVVPVVYCNLEITATANGYKMTGALVCENEIQYNVAVEGAIAEAVENVNADAAKATKAIRNGSLVIERNGIEYNALGAQIK